FMAQELQSYVEKITGAVLPIVTDAETLTAHEIVIGKTNRETEGQFDRTALTDQGFVIKADEDNRIWLIGGGELGTKYCIYHLLDEYLGCGLYSPEFEYIPDYDSLGLAYGEDIQVPALISRTIGCRKFYSYFDKMKLGGPYIHAGHTLPVIACGSYDANDPCLSYEGTYQTVLDYVLNILKETPDTYCIGIGQADGKTYCTCDTCTASYELNGYSGHYIKFINRIADAIREDYPNTSICTFAYDFTFAPPKNGVKPADNVIIQFCMSELCRIHNLEDYNFGFSRTDIYLPANITFGEVLKEWSDISENIAIYHYTPNYASYHCIMPNIVDQYYNIRLFAENNAPYVYIAGATLSEVGEFDELRSYLISKALWNPYMTEEEYFGYMNKFLCEYYGPGWEYIRAFIDLAEKETENICMGGTLLFDDPTHITPIDTEYLKSLIEKIDLSSLTVDQIKDPASVDWDAYYEQIDEKDRNFNRLLARGYEYFAKASELAETDEQRDNIDQSSIQLDINYSTLIYSNISLPKAEILKQIYKRALDVFIANGTIDEFDGYTYVYKFDDLVCEPIYKESKIFRIEFNKNLYHKMLKYGITYLYECNNNFNTVPEEQLDFSNPPTGGYGTPFAAWHPSK
ncbi:MAG: DUF4838 domain-containing protein, partial [Clostridia bacterium]|nr:DUF4838 domain-containing protein [Clostridia bacterium]